MRQLILTAAALLALSAAPAGAGLLLTGPGMQSPDAIIVLSSGDNRQQLASAE